MREWLLVAGAAVSDSSLHAVVFRASVSVAAGTCTDCRCVHCPVWLRVCADPESGQLLFAGPRVRMGLHWAQKGSVAIGFHAITRHKVYGGPPVQKASEISDAANGGQVVLSEVRVCFCRASATISRRVLLHLAAAAAWDLDVTTVCCMCLAVPALQEAVQQLSEDLSLAGFPVIKLLGMFQLSTVSNPVYLYGCTEVVGRPLKRQFTELRKITQLWPAPGQAVRAHPGL